MAEECKQVAREKRILKTLRIFIDNNGDITDELLARSLAIEGIQSSSSTVGRDLTINLKKLFSEQNRGNVSKINNLNGDGFTDEQASVLAFITKKRKDNKYKGQVKGGKQSVFNNNIEKDDSTSKFNGSKKRRG